MRLHQTYLKFVYKWAAAAGLVGSFGFAYCCVVNETAYPPYMALLAPGMSAPIKKLLRRYSLGGLVLCGGLTNLWNLLFFCAVTACTIM